MVDNFSMDQGRGWGWGWEGDRRQISSSNASEVLLTHLPLTSCCTPWLGRVESGLGTLDLNISDFQEKSEGLSLGSTKSMLVT